MFLWFPVLDLARAPRRTARKKGSGYENVVVPPLGEGETLGTRMVLYLLPDIFTDIREVKIPRFRCTCTGSMILVSNIFVDVCTFTRN